MPLGSGGNRSPGVTLTQGWSVLMGGVEGVSSDASAQDLER